MLPRYRAIVTLVSTTSCALMYHSCQLDVDNTSILTRVTKTALLSLTPAISHSDSSSQKTTRDPITSKSPASSANNITCQIERHNGHTVIYRDKNNFLQKRNSFKQGGSSRLQVISDFDYTMTRFFVSSGKRGASCHCLIEDSGFLPTTYQTQAHALFQYYYPIEVSSTLSVPEKVPFMQEWVEKAHELLLLSNLRQSQIKYAVANALANNTTDLRPGAVELLLKLHQENIPVLLFSAGLADVIEEVLRQKCGDTGTSNAGAHIVSNHMIFKDDVLVGFSSPSFHVFNKKALYAKKSPYFAIRGLKDRRNLILLGDSLGDTTMCEGLQISDGSKIKIGFLNDKVERLPDYLMAYDVILLGDPDFSFVSSLIEDITGG